MNLLINKRTHQTTFVKTHSYYQVNKTLTFVTQPIYIIICKRYNHPSSRHHGRTLIEKCVDTACKNFDNNAYKILTMKKDSSAKVIQENNTNKQASHTVENTKRPLKESDNTNLFKTLKILNV